jgi:hypothetical protein
MATMKQANKRAMRAFFIVLQFERSYDNFGARRKKVVNSIGCAEVPFQIFVSEHRFCIYVLKRQGNKRVG